MSEPLTAKHWPTLVFEDENGDFCRCDCGEQGFDYKQGREWFAQHLATLDADRERPCHCGKSWADHDTHYPEPAAGEGR